MKKLIIAAAVVAIGFVANAASVAWGGYVMNNLDAEETAREGTVFNAIYIGSNDYSAMLSTFVYDTYTGLVGTGTGSSFQAAAGQTILGTHTLTAQEAEDYTFQDLVARADADGGVNGNWLITMFDSTTPDYFWVGQYAVSGATDSTGAGDIRDTSFAIGGSMIEGVTDSHDPGPEPVPEPTSGLLLLLGVAGLALRRRNA